MLRRRRMVESQHFTFIHTCAHNGSGSVCVSIGSTMNTTYASNDDEDASTLIVIMMLLLMT